MSARSARLLHDHSTTAEAECVHRTPAGSWAADGDCRPQTPREEDSPCSSSFCTSSRFSSPSFLPRRRFLPPCVRKGARASGAGAGRVQPGVGARHLNKRRQLNNQTHLALILWHVKRLLRLTANNPLVCPSSTASRTAPRRTPVVGPTAPSRRCRAPSRVGVPLPQACFAKWDPPGRPGAHRPHPDHPAESPPTDWSRSSRPARLGERGQDRACGASTGVCQHLQLRRALHSSLRSDPMSSHYAAVTALSLCSTCASGSLTITWLMFAAGGLPTAANVLPLMATPAIARVPSRKAAS